MKSTVVTVCIFGLLGLMLVSRADDRKGGDRQVHRLMERTHEGRRSPYGRLRQIVEGGDAAWPAIEQTVQGFDPMCKALLESPNDEIKGCADGYVDAVKEIVAATKRRDAKGVAEGLRSLKESCGDCHYKGGVGGRLDDEDEEKDEHEEKSEDEPPTREGRRRSRG